MHQLQHGGAVRHHHQRARLGGADGLFQLAQEGDFALRIHRARRLVHEQDLRFRHETTGERHELPLAAREQRARFADRQLPALRMLGHETVQPGESRHIGQAPGVGGRPVEQHVVAQRAAEEARVLRDEADTGAVVGRVDLAQVDPVGFDLAFGGLVQAGQQAQHGALARADAAEHGDPFTGLEGQRHPLQHPRPFGAALRRMRRIGKAHLAQPDAAGEFAPRHIGAARFTLDRLVHHAVERTHGGTRALVARGQLHHAHQRRHTARGKHYRTDERAGSDDALVDQPHAPHQHQHGDDLLGHGREIVGPARDAA